MSELQKYRADELLGDTLVCQATQADIAIEADRATIADLQSKCAELHERLARSEADEWKVLRVLMLLQDVHGNELTWGSEAYRKTGRAIDLLEDVRSALAAADGKQQPFDGGTYDDDQCGGEA